MIQPYTSGTSRRSHSIDRQKKSRLPQCSPKDWPDPSKDWFPYGAFWLCPNNLFLSTIFFSWRRPWLRRPAKFSYVANRENLLVWKTLVFQIIHIVIPKVHVCEGSENNQRQASKKGLNWSVLKSRSISVHRCFSASTRGSVPLPAMTTQPLPRPSSSGAKLNFLCILCVLWSALKLCAHFCWYLQTAPRPESSSLHWPARPSSAPLVPGGWEEEEVEEQAVLEEEEEEEQGLVKWRRRRDPDAF